MLLSDFFPESFSVCVFSGQIWQEWTQSSNGQPSKRDLEAQGPAWRKGDDAFFYKRKALYNEIERMGREEGYTLVTAAKLLEDRRIAAEISITQLQNQLLTAATARRRIAREAADAAAAAATAAAAAAAAATAAPESSGE